MDLMAAADLMAVGVDLTTMVVVRLVTETDVMNGVGSTVADSKLAVGLTMADLKLAVGLTAVANMAESSFSNKLSGAHCRLLSADSYHR